MKRHITTQDIIRKYRSEYHRLRAHEARLNHELFRLKKRIRQIEADEQLSVNNHTLLSDLLTQAEQKKAKLEAEPASKERDKQLKKAVSAYKDLNAKFKRSDYHLAVLEKKKDKDNVAKYILKEAKRDEVTVRIQAAYAVWMRFEKIQQQENADFEAFAIQYQNQKTAVTEQLHTSITTTSSIQPLPRFVTIVLKTKPANVYFQSYSPTSHSKTDYLLFRQVPAQQKVHEPTGK